MYSILTGFNDDQTSNTAAGDLEKSFYFECSETEIISFVGKCDGKIDCTNGKDEEDCQTYIGMYMSLVTYKLCSVDSNSMHYGVKYSSVHFATPVFRSFK